MYQDQASYSLVTIPSSTKIVCYLPSITLFLRSFHCSFQLQLLIDASARLAIFHQRNSVAKGLKPLDLIENYISVIMTTCEDEAVS